MLYTKPQWPQSFLISTRLADFVKNYTYCNVTVFPIFRFSNLLSGKNEGFFERWYVFQVYFIPYLSKFRLFWQFLWGFCELFSINGLQFWTISTFFDWVEDWRYQTFMQHYSKLLTSSMLINFFLLKDIFFEFRKIMEWVDIYMYQKFLIALQCN